MTRLLSLGLAAFLALTPFAAAAQDSTVNLAVAEPEVTPPFAPVDGADADLDALVWQKRPIVVFADSPLDPAFKEQIRYLEDHWSELAQRDVVVITDTTPDPASDVRRKLRPRGFSLVIIAKDGTVNLRKPAPWDAREIIRSIDKMPIRRDEIREERGF
ncbi:hypothetical protein DEM26_15065 [Thioclava sp. NG1]|uniref:DUF4174 domain-containing protein n=1 Tax=Thioclava sp. NG1 TaxID=2182426 RepID=UPI000D6172F3|nr:DUF4174 domain-containing protein [Thioclava sp. NG1]PWE49171.1 hypothetical protein DEM26_15065 [Thioclava sp. NG1]